MGAKDGEDAGPEAVLRMREVVQRRLQRGGKGGAAVLAFWQDVASRLHERGRVDAASCLLVGKGDVAGVLATLTTALAAALQDEEGWDGARAAEWTVEVAATVRDWEKRGGARSVADVAAERGGRVGGYRRLSECRSGPIRPLTRWQRVSECRLVYRLSWASASLLGAMAQYAGDRSMVCKLNRGMLMQLAAVGSKEVFRAAVVVLEVHGLVVRQRQADGKTWWYLGEEFGDGLAAPGVDPTDGARRIAELAREAAGGSKGRSGRGEASVEIAADGASSTVKVEARGDDGTAAAAADVDPGGRAVWRAEAEGGGREARAAGLSGDGGAVRAGADGPTSTASGEFGRDGGGRARGRAAAEGGGEATAAGRARLDTGFGTARAAVDRAAAVANEQQEAARLETGGAVEAGVPTEDVAEADARDASEDRRPGSGTRGDASAGQGPESGTGAAEGVAAAVRRRYTAMREAVASEVVPVGPDKGRPMLVAEFVAEVGERADALLPVLPYVAEVLSGKLDREGEVEWPRVRMVRYAQPILQAAVRRAEDEAVDRALEEAARTAAKVREAAARAGDDARRAEIERARRDAPLCSVCGSKVWGLGLPGARDGADLDPPRDGRVCGMCVERLEAGGRQRGGDGA